MEIEFKQGYHSHILRVKSEHTVIEEDVSKTNYGIDENGKINYKDRLGYSVENNVLQQFENIIEDMLYYSKDFYDSLPFIRRLVDMLDTEQKEQLFNQLNKELN